MGYLVYNRIKKEGGGIANYRGETRGKVYFRSALIKIRNKRKLEKTFFEGNLYLIIFE